MSISSYLNHDQTYGQRVDAEMKLQTPGVKDLHLDDQSKKDSAESDHPERRSTILCVSADTSSKDANNSLSHIPDMSPSVCQVP